MLQSKGNHTQGTLHEGIVWTSESTMEMWMIIIITTTTITTPEHSHKGGCPHLCELLCSALTPVPQPPLPHRSLLRQLPAPCLRAGLGPSRWSRWETGGKTDPFSCQFYHLPCIAYHHHYPHSWKKPRKPCPENNSTILKHFKFSKQQIREKNISTSARWWTGIIES